MYCVFIPPENSRYINKDAMRFCLRKPLYRGIAVTFCDSAICKKENDYGLMKITTSWLLLLDLYLFPY